MSEEETLQPTVIGILGNETSKMIDRQLTEMSTFDLNTISDLGLQLSPAADVPAATSTHPAATSTHPAATSSESVSVRFLF